jgi:hypothetical protein
MRIMLAAGAILSLAACGPGSAYDNGVRNGFRESAVQGCLAASRNAPPSGANVDWNRLCGCAIDRYMANRSTDQLRHADPHDPALREVSQQCLLEQLNAAAGGNDAAPARGGEKGAQPAK